MDLLEGLVGVCVDEWHYGCVYGNLDVILNDFEAQVELLVFVSNNFGMCASTLRTQSNFGAHLAGNSS